MPRYDYRCTACDERFEVERKIDEAGAESCPACGSPAKRVFTPVGVHFRGTGFHNTDYRPASKGESSEAPCPAKSEGASACESCPAKN